MKACHSSGSPSPGDGTSKPPKRRLMQRLRTFGRNRDGSYAIEFGIVAMPFLLLFVGLFEIALMFFANQVLETGVSDAARLIRTGQAQAMTETDFKQAICDKIDGLFSCPNGLIVDVRTYQSFAQGGSSSAGGGLEPPLDADGNIQVNGNFSPGGSGDIVVVRVFYEWPLIAPVLSASLGETASGNVLLAATAAFRNEPF